MIWWRFWSFSHRVQQTAFIYVTNPCYKNHIAKISERHLLLLLCQPENYLLLIQRVLLFHFLEIWITKNSACLQTVLLVLDNNDNNVYLYHTEEKENWFCLNLIISGRNCQTNIDDCKLYDQPCQNGATCIDGIVNYTCNCKPGYTGRNCTEDIDECQFGFCQNNANCTHSVNNYTCHCLPGFTDFNCSTDINECESNPCEHSTNCTDLVNDYNCTCLPGFTGNLYASNCFDRICGMSSMTGASFRGKGEGSEGNKNFITLCVTLSFLTFHSRLTWL